MSLAVVDQPHTNQRGGVWFLSGHRDHVLSIATSTYDVFATCDAQGYGLLWKFDASLPDSSPVHVSRITTDRRAVTDSCFLNSTQLCTAQGDGRVVVWDVEKSKEMQSLSRVPSRGKSVNWPVINAVTSWEGKFVAFGGDDGYLVLGCATVKEPVALFNVRAPILSVAATHNSLLVGDVLGNLHLFDTRMFKSLYGFQGHRDAITFVSLNEDASLAVTYSMDDTLVLWNALPFALGTGDRLLYKGDFQQGGTQTLLRCDWGQSKGVLVPLGDGHVAHMSSLAPDSARTTLSVRHRLGPVRCAAFVGDDYAVSSAEAEVIFQRT